MLLIEGSQVVHADGIILRGAATIDESAITGDSTYVLCESGGRDRVLRDSLVVSGTIILEVIPRLKHSADWIGHANCAGCVISNHTHRERDARDNHVPRLINNEENDRCAGK